MKDQLFEGATVEQALQAAARGLGTPAERLRYVVLDPGQPAARGLEARPARIAVLFDKAPPAAAPAAREAVPAPAAAAPAAGPAGVSAAASEIRELVRELARAAEVDLSADVSVSDEALVVKIAGSGRDLLLEDDADALESLEYLLQLSYRRAIEPRRLVVDCEGFRADRDRALREEALALAAQVAGDGVARRTRALNSYERRVVHTVLTDHPAVHTFSVGEGADRRVTVAPRPRADEPA
jgi:spoIIIJ-associated protein